MNEPSTPTTWKPGDRALCVKHDEWKFSKSDSEICFNCARPKYGVVYIVVSVDCITLKGVTGLILANMPAQVKFNAKNFRKVVPACDRTSLSHEKDNVNHNLNPRHHGIRGTFDPFEGS